ncbi:hypothetical protein PRUPE_7G046700 [Prunus persica]|uniref:Uncharacterized protein n=1 Tax=Prunus persica TaxID=3760 RepID=A0A251N6P3_PRUPE|nr:hypothetical protein PRUPE_7G046700 [Prunus persica]
MLMTQMEKVRFLLMHDGSMEIGGRLGRDAGQSFQPLWPVISFVFIDLSNFIAYLLWSLYFLVPHPPLIIPLYIFIFTLFYIIFLNPRYKKMFISDLMIDIIIFNFFLWEFST